MRIGRRVAKVLFWVLVFCLSVLGGGLWFAYTYVTDSANAARAIKQYAVKYLPTAVVEPARVHVARLFNEVTLHDTRVYQWIRGTRFQTLHIPRLNVQVNTRKLLRGELDVREVDVVWPTLRICQRADGTWNLQGLLADPWPSPWLDKTPPIVIENGTIELVCRDDAPAHPAAAPAAPPAGPAGPTVGGRRLATILSKVSLRVKQERVGRFVYRFDGTATSDVLERLRLVGTVDLETGRVTLEGDLTGLTISDALRQRIPPEAQPAFKSLALNGGVVDLDRVRVGYDAKAPAGRRLHYGVQARLRDGVWNCPRLPFPVNDLSAAVDVEDGLLTLLHAEGTHGKTTLRARGKMRLGDPERAPMELHIGLSDFELDEARLRRWTPRQYDELWDVFKPGGLIGAEIDLARATPGGPIEMGASVTCHDVAVTYRHFPYPIDHLRGSLILAKKTLQVDLQTTSVGGQPLHLKGTIENPGPDAVVRLDIAADSVPIDAVLLKALQPDVRKVVKGFRPSGTVKAHAAVFREPMPGRPEGRIAIDAEIDLTERCEITWDKLPYPVRNLTGRLELHPDHWVFRDMQGRNGQARIRASGEVFKLPGKLENGEDRLRVHVDLKAANLPFSDELREALPPEWKSTWRTINPSGASDVEATVDVDPQRRRDETHIVIDPLPGSTVKLKVVRSPQPKHLDRGGEIELRMDDVHGRFRFDNGVVTMNDVSVLFGGAPVRLDHGRVVVKGNGQFDLAVSDLWIKGIRIDAELRKKMPPLMAQFAHRLDEGRAFTARGDLRIGWSGVENEPAWCGWDNVHVVLNDNKLNTGIPLEHIQGELRQVKGWSNGLGVWVEGIMNLESVVILGQQITRVESPFQMKDGVAELVDLRGKFLGGDLWARGRVTLAETPSYWATVSLHNARLEEYARTLGGRREYRGDISARIDCNGLGSDLRTLQGSGEAHITDGDLGELPAYFRPVALVNRTFNPDVPRVRIKTAFDSVDLAFTITHGLWKLDPVKFTGNAFSLQGSGTLDPQSNVDLRLEPLLGRDRFHLPIVSDLSLAASAPLLRVHVTGTLAHPDFSVEPLPLLQRDPAARTDRRPSRLFRTQ